MPKTVYAFIDSQNLNLGVRSVGWKIDYPRFRLFLRNKYQVEKAFMFIGMIGNNQALYTKLQAAGFILIFKPTVQYFKEGKQAVKGNVDAELVLHAAAIEYQDYDQAIIVTGDGDFACLMEFLKNRNKLKVILTPNRRYSSLLAPYKQYVVRVDDVITAFGTKKTRTSGRSKP